MTKPLLLLFDVDQIRCIVIVQLEKLTNAFDNQLSQRNKWNSNPMSKLGEESANHGQNFTEAFRVKLLTLLRALFLFLISGLLFLSTLCSIFSLLFVRFNFLLGPLRIALSLRFSLLSLLFFNGSKFFSSFFFFLR